MSGPFLGPGNGPILGPRHMVFYCGVLFGGVQTEARFFFNWVDWCAQQAQLQGHEPLWLNMDETCVQRGMPTASGAVVGPTWWSKGHEPVDGYGGRHKRTAMSLLLTVSPEEAVQASLPQIFLGNRVVLPRWVADVAEEDTSLLWRQRSSWNCEATMVKYLEHLASVLQDFGGRQPILVCDCAPMHVTDKVVRAATRLNIWFVLVPPATTFMLQPADVGVIRHVKADLRRRQEASKQSFSHGNVPTEEWVRCLLTVQHVMRTRSWQSVFERCGILGSRLRLPLLLQDLRSCAFSEGDGAVQFPTPEAMANFYPKSIAKKFWLLMQPTLPQLD